MTDSQDVVTCPLCKGHGEIRRAELDTVVADLFDNGGEHRVVGAEVVDGLLHVETQARRGASIPLYRDENTYT